MLRQQYRLNCWALQNPRTVNEYRNCTLVQLLALNTLYCAYRYHILHEAWKLFFSFTISCFSLLFLLLCSHLSVCVCVCVSVYISIFLSVFLYFRLLRPFFLVHFKSHINFSHWWKLVIRPILAKFRVGSSLVFLIAVSVILKFVKKSAITTTW